MLHRVTRSRALALAGVVALVVAWSVAATRPTTKPTTVPAGEWRSLFDGKTLKGWKVADYAGHGEPEVQEGNLVLPFGEGLTGVTWDTDQKADPLPKMNYEISLEAQKLTGVDFFCGLTFPVADTHATLVVGGWGGSVVGISSLDGLDAAHNEYSVDRKFEKNRWYKVRLRVLPDKIQAWIDDEQVIDAVTKGRKVSVRPDIEASTPLGICSWQTTAAVRDVKVRAVKAEKAKAS